MLSYEQERALLARDRMRLLTVYGIPFYVSFSVLDYIVARDFLFEFAAYRILAGIAASAFLFASYTRVGMKFIEWLLVATIAIASMWISVMCYRLGGFSATYYPGLMLAQFFTLFVPFSTASIIVCQALIVLGYVAINGVHGDWSSAPQPIAFLSGSALTCAIQAYAVSATRRREYDLRLEVSEARQAQERVFSTVTHELRTPLSLILTPAQAELREATNEATKRRQKVIVRNGLRLLRLVNQLLELARLSSQRLSNLPRATNVASLVAAILDDAEFRTSELGLALKRTLPPSIRILEVDARHVETIVVNLLGNAIKFTPRGGQIEVGLDYGDTEVTLWVRDDGPGIPEDIQRRIFDRFSQAEEVASLDGGSGLGLAVVAELAELIGGRVAVQSELGSGSEFRVSFPLLESDSVVSPKSSLGPMAELSRQASLEFSPSAHRSLSKTSHCHRLKAPLHLLLVEDNDELREELTGILIEDYTVTAVSDGQKALEELAQREFALVCTDVQMPVVDGIELVRSIRASSAFAELPIVMLSAYAAIEDRIAGLRLGVDSYVAKPPDVDELRAVVQGLLRSRLKVFGRYLLEERLGEGGYGSVYLSKDMVSGETLAIKLQNDSDLLNSTAENQLLKERDILTELSHPNIVRLYEHGSSDGTVHLAMEFLSGYNGDEILTEVGKFSNGQLALFGYQVASALAALHQSSLVHRDVKLPNVMITDDRGLVERCKLIDFGIAELDGQSFDTLGTVRYTAPELLDGCPASSASDIFALGVALHRAATGEFPFSGYSSDEVITAISLGKRTSVAGRSLADSRIADAIEACLRGDAGTRITADELVTTFKSLPFEDFPCSTASANTLGLSSSLAVDPR